MTPRRAMTARNNCECRPTSIVPSQAGSWIESARDGFSGMLKCRHYDKGIQPGCMIRYYITDRSQLGSTTALLANIAGQLAAGIEMIQLRERDLSARELLTLAEAVLRLPNACGMRLLINDRTDVALACGAAGVHLRANFVAPARIRSIAPEGFLVGV
jgi:hypothetical protein